MGKQEKSFQNYVMKIGRPLGFYRTSLSTGSGFPDITAFHENDRYSLIELKDLILGKRGDRLLKQFFEDSQPPWYAEYLQLGRKRLFVAFRVRNSEEASRSYALIQLNMNLVLRLSNNVLKFSDLKHEYGYEEYDKCIDMLKAVEYKSTPEVISDR